MIKHIVMFKLKDEAEGKSREENIKEALEKLSGFKASIPELIEFKVVTNSEKAPQDNCTLALICDFKDIDGLNAYQVHPVHKAFGAFIAPRHEGRSCIDYEY